MIQSLKKLNKKAVKRFYNTFADQKNIQTIIH
jgi:hypothetical protein